MSVYTNNPFPGIRSYEPEESHLFFGRDRPVSNVISLLTDTRFVALIGYSGSGKSSLIKAGIIPAVIKQGMLPGNTEEWLVVYFRPGEDPYRSLAEAVLKAVEITGTGYEYNINSIAQEIEDKGTLRYAFSRFGKGGNTRWLLIADQFEELFRLKQNEDDAIEHCRIQGFINLLLSGLQEADLPVYVLISMRSDYLDTITEYPGLPEAFNEGAYLLPRNTPAEIKDIIEKPVVTAGISISEDLVALLIKDTNNDPDQLPVLQHALMRTWEYWKQHAAREKKITVEHYRAIGTISTALSIHAEEVFLSLHSDKQRLIAEKIFKALTDVTTDSKTARRPARLQELADLSGATVLDIVEVINEFREQGRDFLQPGNKVSLQEDTVIDITHESIMRIWKRLTGWIQEEAKSAGLYQRLSNAAERFQDGEAGLWADPDLALAVKWQQEQKPNAAWAARYDEHYDRALAFLNNSRQHALKEVEKKEHKQKTELRKARNYAIVLAAAAAVSFLLFVYSYYQGVKSGASEKMARENEKKARIAGAHALERQKEATLLGRIATQQQEITAEERLISEEQKRNALQQERKALDQERKALAAQADAVREKKDALDQKQKAEHQKQVAEHQKQVAEQQEELAQKAEKESQRLRKLSIARTMAVESQKLGNNTDDDLAALLALQSFQFTEQNKGFKNDRDIFAAMARVADARPVLKGHKGIVRGIALDGNGRVLVSCSEDGTVKLWNITDDGAYRFIRQLSYAVAKAGELRCIAIGNDGKTITAGMTDGHLLVWKTDNNISAPIMVQAHESIISSICFGSNDTFFTAGTDGKVKSWNVQHVALPLYTADLKSPVLSLACSRGAVACGTMAGDISVFRKEQFSATPFQHYHSTADAVKSLAFNGSGDLLACGNPTGKIFIYDLHYSQKRPMELVGHLSTVTALCFSSDNKTLASSSYDKTIRVWTLASLNQNPVVITDNQSWVMDLTYAPDGKKLISAGADRTIRIFNVDEEDMAGTICGKLKRNLTPDEWNEYIGKDIPYQKTCKDKP